MKIRYCWRCGMDVPMLDSEEGKIASQLFAEGFQEARKQMKHQSQKTSENCWTIIKT